ncbi:hypothetical protein CROQUDRAFT_38023, partial [Cronartium quercuum f. sp. fusiforme G11]
RKHRTTRAAVSDDASILKALAEDFCTKANSKHCQQKLLGQGCPSNFCWR